MLMINILLAKIFMQALFPSVPAWIVVAGLVAMMMLFNLRIIRLVANFNSMIVVLQVSTMIVCLGLVINGVMQGESSGTLVSITPFRPENSHVIPMITGATILCFSFLGFDGISSLSEETPDAGRGSQGQISHRAD